MTRRSKTSDTFRFRFEDTDPLHNGDPKQLCIALMQADTEDEVIALLRIAGYWDDTVFWRFYGDNEDNWGTVGNQQSSPEAALVEKLINSVDARLMLECMLKGIAPKSSKAPSTVREAVATFFQPDVDPKSEHTGRISELTPKERTQLARSISLAATGNKPPGNPSFTISDEGEGQTPDRLPETILSLVRGNKLYIPFVQGKYNMGGTGVFRFCGTRNLQLVLSRRNPRVLYQSPDDSSREFWGFTVVRREDPQRGRRNSVYTYLAPLGAPERPRKGDVLRFKADTMPIFPEASSPYQRHSAWGTLIKLYEYMATGFKSHILMRDGLLGRADLLLPDVALPIRFHECRDYRGEERSVETTLTGLSVRLEDDKGSNLEEAPWSGTLRAAGERMTARIYAFKKGRAGTYRRQEGIVFVINGQTHGHLSQNFFRRTRVGLSYLADSLLVILDCSGFTGRSREDLFMTSRDRLAGGDLRGEIEAALESMLREHEGLRALKNRRRDQEVEAKIKNDKPLGEVLQSLLRQYPTLSALFVEGKRLSDPSKSLKVRGKEKPFKGARFPTIFKFKDKDYGQELRRSCHINMRTRITFETDAANDFFDRPLEKGEFTLQLVAGDEPSPVQDYALHLNNGIATLSIKLPDNTREGDVLGFEAMVRSTDRLEPFTNRFILNVQEAAPITAGTGQRRKPPSTEEGKERETPASVAIPKIREVSEEEWEDQDPHFDKHTALRIKHAGSDDTEQEPGKPKDIYDFYVNVDNLYLKHELKRAARDVQLTRARFIYGLVLLGMGLLQDEASRNRKSVEGGNGEAAEEEEGGKIEKRVEEFTRAVAPVLLPMIDYLGELNVEEEPVAAGLF